MTNEECYQAWAPDGSPWSVWAKPVLFAALDRVPATSVVGPDDLVDLSWFPEAAGERAVIVDLPGPASVRAGLVLARKGYRPVPLFNGNIGAEPRFDVLDAAAVADRLRAGAEQLQALTLPISAPPAFLLDDRRCRAPSPVVPEQFDNRWVVFPQDFPSGTFLRAQGVAEVVLVQMQPGPPQEDLSHVLLRWREAGILLRQAGLNTAGPIAELPPIVPPSLFRRAWHRAVVLLGFRRNDTGGFGDYGRGATTG